MLSLDSPEWAHLTHCYGTAEDIPPLLRELENFPQDLPYDDEPWHTLWSSLCHQSDIYSASYAAVPHILRIAAASPDRICTSYILLPACIEASRLSGFSPPVPDFLTLSYFESIRAIPTIIADCFDREWDDNFVRAATVALCAVKGHEKLAYAIMDLSEDMLEKFSAWIDENRLHKHPPEQLPIKPIGPLPPNTTFTA